MKKLIFVTLALTALSPSPAGAGNILPCMDRNNPWPHLPESYCNGSEGQKLSPATPEVGGGKVRNGGGSSSGSDGSSSSGGGSSSGGDDGSSGGSSGSGSSSGGGVDPSCKGKGGGNCGVGLGGGGGNGTGNEGNGKGPPGGQSHDDHPVGGRK